MADIVERLRGSICYASTNKEWPNSLLREAADEIERLRGEIKRLREPTDEMLEAGADMDCKAHTENRSGAGDWSSEQVAEAVYRAMIDKVESE